MRYIKAALLGFVLGTAAGVVVGGGYNWLSFHADAPQDPSAKASLLASTIAASLNCAAFFAVVGALAGILIAALRRKP